MTRKEENINVKKKHYESNFLASFEKLIKFVRDNINKKNYYMRLFDFCSDEEKVQNNQVKCKIDLDMKYIYENYVNFDEIIEVLMCINNYLFLTSKRNGKGRVSGGARDHN